MSKSYNTQGDLARLLNEFFVQKCKITLSKPQAKILPHIILGMIDAESVVTKDISKKISSHFYDVYLDSIERRIRRFFNNNNFDVYSFYHKFIDYVVSNYKVSHPDNRVHISFDHSYSNDDFTILSFSLRIGKQGIPLWFKCFKGRGKNGSMKTSHILEGINFVSNLFKDKDYKLIFLADRFFNSNHIMKHIDFLNHYYVIRSKNTTKVLVQQKYETHPIWRRLSQIKPFIYKSKIFENVLFSTKNPFRANLVISKSFGHDEAWYLITNLDTTRAVKDYAYRWSCECVFKNQKSNGFYLESTHTKNVKAFTSLFCLLNVGLVWLTILGSDYSKNQHNYKRYYNIKLTCTKKIKGVSKRIMSLFEIGLTLFNLCYNSIRSFKLKTNFVLYDL